MYRPEIKVVDCTIRDGGLMNKSRFDLEMVRRVFRAVDASGVDIIELGYKNSKTMFDPKEFGLWRFCDEEDLRRAVEGVERRAKIAVMQDAHKAYAEDLLPKSESVIDIVRIATYVKDVDKAIHLANAAVAKGYEACINIMSISQVIERELNEALEQIEAETKVLAVTIVDSFGVLYSEDVDYFVEKFKRHIKTKEIGIHCHNNKQLAYANTIEGIIKGCNYVDGTLYGLGRGAGNCPLELLVSFLKNPKFNLRPLVEVIGSEIMPLTKTIEWGYRIPYMLDGVFNRHPDAAIRVMALPDGDPEKTDYAAFYDKSILDEVVR
jgi:4-hydroxy 2-oxovalerate aldolase